jgi:hypothetical protein
MLGLKYIINVILLYRYLSGVLDPAGAPEDLVGLMQEVCEPCGEEDILLR